MDINKTPVFIGTSGYNYDDWKGTFAPEKSLNYDLLTHYVKSGLNFLELTYTFYRMPITEKIAGIVERSGDNMRLSVRLTKSLMRKNPPKADIAAFKEGIAPAVESGRLAALFADFHHLFTAGKENFGILEALRDSFPEAPLFLELTNSTWHKSSYYEKFKNAEIGLCVIDGPSFKGFAPYYPICSGGGVYFRLYGKNPAWISSGDRFLDYSYSDEELKKFAADARDVSVMAKNIYFSFCNVEKGNAPKDALRLKNIIDK